MSRFSKTVWLLVIILSLAVAAPVLAVAAVDAPGTTVRHGDISGKDMASVKVVGRSNDREPDQIGQCQQVLVNHQLDVIKTGPGVGTVDPWFFLKREIYYFEEGDGSDLAYNGTSLLLPDGDEGDPSPKSDILAQIVTFDTDLGSVFIAYQRLMLDSNPKDKVYGELWLLDKDGDIDLEDPDRYRVFRWEVTDSEQEWAPESLLVDKGTLAQLAGQKIALLLRTETDGTDPETGPEAEKEWVLFDDVTMTACPAEGDGEAVYLPIVIAK